MKQNKYMNRALKSRDPRFARVLGKLGYEATPDKASSKQLAAKRAAAAAAYAAPVTAPAPASAKPEIAVSELFNLRADYEKKFGKRAYMGWDAAALRVKLAEAPTEAAHYARRDMRAAE